MGRRPPMGGRQRRTPRPAPPPPSLLPAAVDTSHCPLPLKSPRIIQWGRTDRRAGGGRSRPARRLAPTNDRPHPPRIIFPLLPFLPFSICSCRRSFPRLAIAERTRTTNSVVGISKPQRASVVLVVDCTERERESVVGRSAISTRLRSHSFHRRWTAASNAASLHLLPSLARPLLSTPPPHGRGACRPGGRPPAATAASSPSPSVAARSS